MLDFVIITFLVFMGIIVLSLLAKWILRFGSELDYLHNQIKKTEGKEKRYWIRKRRKLWLSVLPFIKY